MKSLGEQGFTSSKLVSQKSFLFLGVMSWKGAGWEWSGHLILVPCIINQGRNQLSKGSQQSGPKGLIAWHRYCGAGTPARRWQLPWRGRSWCQTCHWVHCHTEEYRCQMQDPLPTWYHLRRGFSVWFLRVGEHRGKEKLLILLIQVLIRITQSLLPLTNQLDLRLLSQERIKVIHKAGNMSLYTCIFHQIKKT